MTTKKRYDVVIVGAGLAGAILAKVLGRRGKNVLVLEAGDGAGMTWAGYRTYLDAFYTANIKIPNSPYPKNHNAPQPCVTDVKNIQPDRPDTTGYFVQKGPLPFRSSYTRAEGGTTLHWQATCLRMLPQDFELHTRFSQGRDWPLSYADLRPYYRLAEQEIGVAADVAEQQYLDINFAENYVYPMFKIPQSYLDRTLAQGLAGMTIAFDRQTYPVRVISTPQGRNGTPNPAYDNGRGYRPVGAVGNPDLGQRCAGNSNCTPICPIQAKYTALKTLDQINPERVTILTRAVASTIQYDAANGRVTGVVYKRYYDDASPEHTTHEAQGTIYVLAAHAVENAKLLLASGLTGTSELVGKNLMDHPTMLTWGLAPQKIGSFRGPGSTSGIPTLRGGAFRRRRAAFRVEISNWGWNWATGAPFTQVTDLVDQKNMFGRRLRREINRTTPRQFRLGFLVEQLPDPCNRVTIDSAYKDQLGNYRPVIHYNLTDYTRAGMAAAKYTSDLIFQRLGAEDYTHYNPDDPGYVAYEEQGFVYFGAGHFAGTHVMGTTPHNSVVDARQRCWDYPNLFLTGCGNFPTIATSNPTLTMTALAFQAAENILEDLADQE